MNINIRHPLFIFIVIIAILIPLPVSAQKPCPSSMVTESQWFNASNGNGKALTGSALAAFKRGLQSQGWRNFSGVVLRGGVWMLKASRTITISQCFVTPVLPGVYYDDIGKCLRSLATGKPMPNQRCVEPM